MEENVLKRQVWHILASNQSCISQYIRVKQIYSNDSLNRYLVLVNSDELNSIEYVSADQWNV